MTRKMAYIGLSFFTGLFLASYFDFKLSLIVGGVLLIPALAFFLFQKRIKPCVTVCIFSLAAGFLWLGLYSVAVYMPVVSSDGNVISVVGMITKASDYSGDKSYYIIDASVNGRPCRISVTGESGYSVGERVTAVGKAEKPVNTYTFAAYDYYRSKGVFLSVKEAQMSLISDSFSLRRAASDYSSYIGNTIDGVLTGDEGLLMKSLVFGDKTSLDEDILTSFSKSGIRHIISVSGFHLAVVTGVIFLLMKPVLKNKYLRFAIAEVFIWGYAFLSALSPSVIRAALMLTIFMLGELIARKADVLNSLGIALIVMTVAMPFAARDVSIVLSAAGVIGIGAVAPWFIDGIYFAKSKILTYAAKSVVAMLVCSVFSFPFICIFFNEVSLVSVIGNIFVVPLCTAALVCGVIIALFGGVTIIANPLLIVGGLFCKAALFLCDIISEIPYSTVFVGENYAVAVIIIATAAVALSWFIFKHKKTLAAVTALSLVLIFAGNAVNSYITRDLLTISVFSGRYSSTVISKGNRALIVSGNGNAQTDALKIYLVSKGIEKIDYLIIPENPSHIASEYNENLSRYEATGVIVSNGAVIPNGTEILGANVSQMLEMGADIGFCGCTVSVRKDSTQVHYGEFSMLCSGNSTQSFTVAVNGDEDISCAKNIYTEYDEYCAGYSVICDEKSNVKVVRIENGNRK